jgi:hypothetical protein
MELNQGALLPAELRPLRHQVEVRCRGACARSLHSCMEGPTARHVICGDPNTTMGCWPLIAAAACALSRARLECRASAWRRRCCCPSRVAHCCATCNHHHRHHQAYTLARIQSFAYQFAARLNAPLTKEQVEMLTQEVLASLASCQEPLQLMPQQNLRLVLRHDCL